MTTVDAAAVIWVVDDDRSVRFVLATALRQAGWEVVNVDGTLLAQKPKIAPHVPAMRQALAEASGMEFSGIGRRDGAHRIRH